MRYDYEFYEERQRNDAWKKLEQLGMSLGKHLDTRNNHLRQKDVILKQALCEYKSYLKSEGLENFKGLDVLHSVLPEIEKSPYSGITRLVSTARRRVR